MFEHRDANRPEQGEFWGESSRLPAAKSGGFYRRLGETLAAIGFAEKVREACLPAYRDAAAGGRPGIDPAVYFKMLMVGFFKNLGSARAIAARCEDSLSVRAVLGYGLGEGTPDLSLLMRALTGCGAAKLRVALPARALETDSTPAASALAASRAGC
ncbi:MAG: transposase [Verrucomicrobiales bacterium]